MTPAAASQPDRETVVPETYPAVTRLDSLDLLRGFCALAVAVYHFNLWGGLALPAALSGILAVFGTYGVSVFFVLSGFSLAHAYGRKFGDGITYEVLARYVRRRVGRLMPLFSVIVIASIAGKVVSGGNVPDAFTIAANFLLLFGFVDPVKTPVIGGWSIGLEVVFYVLFPLIVVLRRHAVTMIGLSVLLAIWVDASLVGIGDLDRGWSAYVQPANHLLFFESGVVAGLSASRTYLGRSLHLFALIAAILAVAVIVSYGSDAFGVVTGYRRLILVPLSVLLVVVTSRIQTGPRMRLWASILGGSSYPLYLIHPLFFFLAVNVLPLGSPLYAVLLGVILAAAVALDLIADKPLQRHIKAGGW